MALIAMAVYDPPGEPRTELLHECLWSLGETADWSRHRLIIVSNGITSESFGPVWLTDGFGDGQTFIENGDNIGTARAINKAWQLRNPGEHCVKIDSDVVIRESGWLDKLEACIERDPKIGIIGLKRKDLDDHPHHPPNHHYKTELRMLPHQKGQPWLIVEKCNHVIGTCQLYNSALLDKIGYLAQMGVYGFDDGFAALRCKLAGFYNCFWPHVEIDHPDPGGTPFTEWKQKYAGERMRRYHQVCEEFKSGKRPIYCGPEEDLS